MTFTQYLMIYSIHCICFLFSLSIFLHRYEETETKTWKKINLIFMIIVYIFYISAIIISCIIGAKNPEVTENINLWLVILLLYCSMIPQVLGILSALLATPIVFIISLIALTKEFIKLTKSLK